MKKLSVLFIVLCCACTKKEEATPLIISDPTVQLKYDGKHTFTVKKGTESLSGSQLQWKSTDELIGKVDANGVFTARKIGKTEVTAQTGGSSVKASVEIVPNSTIFVEPSVDFNQSKQAIKAKEKRKLVQESDDALAYEGDNSKVSLILYVFENDRLTVSGASVTPTTAVATELSTFLRERYPDNSLQGGLRVYASDNKKYSVVAQVTTNSGILVAYTPNTSGGRVAADAASQARLKEAISQLQSK